MKNGRAKANFVNRAEQRKSQEFHQVGHGVELRICVESCACLCPTYFLFKAEFPEKRSKVIVGKQRHMVVPIPSDIAELPWAGQPAQERSGLAQSDVSAMLCEPQGQSHTEKAATNDSHTRSFSG
jgi:hypothetical protein